MPLMSSEDYVTIRQIGKGAFGTAHIVQHKVTGERFVLKRVRLARQSARERQSSVKELLLLSNLRHRNVLEFKGCWVEGGCNLCMLVELCESGDLLTQLRLRHPGSMHFSEEHLQEMAVQLLSALAYLHRSNIAHRDLKTANILITGEGCLKLADFGLSTVLEVETNRLTKTMVGTPNYMSPCVLQEKPYGTPNDIWGLGCVLFELSALKPAFQAFNMAGLIKKVTAGAPPPVPSCYSDHWRNLVRAMLTKEADMRPSAAELLELDWLQPAVRRVAARFGSELPPGAPDLLDRLSDLPPDIMGLMDAFQAQEREEKRRADEARERRKAAVAKWDPLARAAAAAHAAAVAATKQPKLPPLKPHVPRKPLPRVSRAAGGPGGPPRGVPPLHALAAGDGHCGGGDDDANSPRGAAAAAADRACPRRKTYCGEGVVGGCGGGGGGPSRRAPATLPGGVPGVVGLAAADEGAGGLTHAHAAAWLSPLRGGGRVQQQRSDRGEREEGNAAAGGKEEEEEQRMPLSARLWTHRPSSAPPDSPIRRTRRGGKEGSTSGADPRVSGRGDGFDRQGLDGTSPLGPRSPRRTSSCCGGESTSTDPRVGAAVSSPLGRACEGSSSEAKTQERSKRSSLLGQQSDGEGPGGSRRRDPQLRLSRDDGQISEPEAAAAPTAGAGGRGEGGGRGAKKLQAAEGERGLQQEATDTSVTGPAKEDSEPTFRYLPPMRSTSGNSSHHDTGRGSDSGRSGDGRGGGDGGCSDEYGADVSGNERAAAVRHSCPEAALPRRGNSETVLSLVAAPRARNAPRAKAQSGASPQARAPVPSRTAVGEAGRGKAAAGGGGGGVRGAAAGAPGVGTGGRRASETATPGRTGGAAAAAAAGKTAARQTRAAANGGGGGDRPTSGRASGTGDGRVTTATAAGAARPRVSSAGPGSRRTSGTGYGYAATGGAANGSRRSTGTGIRASPGQPGGSGSATTGPGSGEAAGAGGGSGGARGGGGEEGAGRPPPPAATLKTRLSSAAPGSGSRPTSASSRPSSARQQQQQAPAAKAKQQQRQ